MFDTKFYKNRWRPLNFRRIWFVLIVTSNYKNLIYPRCFLCEEAENKQRTPFKKELCEIGEEAIWESRFTSFFFVKNTNFDFKCTQIYQYSIFLSSDTYFSRLFHYKHENIFITGRITAIVLPAAEHLKLGPHHFPEPSFHRIVVLPNCNLVESLFCGKKISESLSERNV